MRVSPSLFRKFSVLAVLVVFAVLICIVNPLREFLPQDDGWAYARSVKHLVETGEYRLDAWAAASMPVQIYLAAGLAVVFGYSLSLLTTSTILLFLCGAIAFYQLLRDSGAKDTLSACLTIALICSPLILLLCFTFMTDVPFLSWVLIACWLYARGLRRQSTTFLFLGGLCAALSIGTRQFGVALPAGLVVAALISPRQQRPGWLNILAGVAAPSVAFVWQLLAATNHPNFTQLVRLVEQSGYLAQPPLQLAMHWLWRCAVIAEYLGLFLAPLVPGLLLLRRQTCDTVHPRAGNERTRPSSLASMLAIGGLFALLTTGHLMTFTNTSGELEPRIQASLMPMIPWVLGQLFAAELPYQITLTLLAAASCAVIVGLLVGHSARTNVWSSRDAASCFLAATGISFFLLHLLYVQLNDTYLIIFLPFVLFFLSGPLNTPRAAATSMRLIAIGTGVTGIILALWLRGDLNRQEVIWRASEEIHAAGVDPMEVRGSLAWGEYHSAFDQWLTSLGPKARPEDYSGPYRLHNPFYAWLTDRQREPAYLVYAANQVPQIGGYSVVTRLPYRDSLLRRRFVYVVKRQFGGPPGP
ncbi:MAG TPA: glycosyltransferase family 39 protein [Bryobacteraceae bacterium]|nr:glycosyltransferase family 39 protein [Bryobacteraceae bacterium]